MNDNVTPSSGFVSGLVNGEAPLLAAFLAKRGRTIIHALDVLEVGRHDRDNPELQAEARRIADTLAGRPVP